jgi:hypothetical protein
VIHPDIQNVPNLGYLINESLYHPGDSFDVPEGAQVQTLFVPVSAPWLKTAESIEFVRAVAPGRAFALHDSLDSPNGKAVVDGLLTDLVRCPYTRLDAGTAFDA